MRELKVHYACRDWGETECGLSFCDFYVFLRVTDHKARVTCKRCNDRLHWRSFYKSIEAYEKEMSQ